ncbi:unnamed protein product, partial [Didymodactylos carnosus]
MTDNNDADEEQNVPDLKVIEKRVLYMLLKLQVIYNVSEMAVDFVAKSLSDILNAVQTSNIDVGLVGNVIRKFGSSYRRTQKATEYFQYVQPVHKQYETINQKQKKKIVKYSYVPFLLSLKAFLALPEVQDDLNRPTLQFNSKKIKDITDGKFARNHPRFNDPT